MVQGNNSQEELKRKIYDNIKLLEVQIKQLKNKLIEIDNEIVQDCIKKNGKHDFKRERDPGLYGESYFICKLCGYEY